MTYGLMDYRERVYKDCLVWKISCCMCAFVHIFIKKCILLGLGPLAHSSVVDHHQ